jgi:dTDP-4-amino-4,6-dideoxygalactose transaminase
MWSRKRIDIGWFDLAAGALACLYARRGPAQSRLEHIWSPQGDSMACLSVRSGLDLLLEALRLAPGSEVLVSAVTIPDMPRILEAHGLIPVPVDVQAETMAPSVEQWRAAITPQTRAILVAHLFGGRGDLEPLLEVAQAHGLAVWEDCAQAFDGQYRGHAQADVSFFSFGPIKTATALGGALVRVQDAALLDAMRRIQAAWPVQSRWAFFCRVMKYSCLKALSQRAAFALFVRLLRLARLNHDRVLNRAVRGFAGPGFFARIRRQPSGPLLTLLARRVRRFRQDMLARRARLGRLLLQQLSPNVAAPGSAQHEHSFWVFPVLCNDPRRLIDRLWAAGFDATQGESMHAVPPPQGRAAQSPNLAQRLLESIVFLPCYAEMTEKAVRQMAMIVQEELNQPPQDQAQAPSSVGRWRRGLAAIRLRRAMKRRQATAT